MRGKPGYREKGGEVRGGRGRREVLKAIGGTYDWEHDIDATTVVMLVAGCWLMSAGCCLTLGSSGRCCGKASSKKAMMSLLSASVRPLMVATGIPPLGFNRKNDAGLSP